MPSASRTTRAIDNERSAASVQAQLIGALPEIVERLPKPHELCSVTIGGNGSTLAGLTAELTAVVDAVRSTLAKPEGV